MSCNIYTHIMCGRVFAIISQLTHIICCGVVFKPLVDTWVSLVPVVVNPRQGALVFLASCAQQTHLGHSLMGCTSAHRYTFMYHMTHKINDVHTGIYIYIYVYMYIIYMHTYILMCVCSFRSKYIRSRE